MRLIGVAVVSALTLALPSPAYAEVGASIAQVADELLSVDRVMSKASEDIRGIDGLTAQFADDVIMSVPGKDFAKGKQAVVAALKAQPGSASARIEWTPFGAGISADGKQGYTFGFMDVRQAAGETVPLKYLAYWQREASGWRVIAYKRARRAEGAHARAPGPVVLPDAKAWANTLHVATVDLAQGLAAAERQFSDRAQVIGLGPAFAEFGTGESMNLGGPAHADFVFGADAIGKLVSEGQPARGSTLHWAADERVVVSDAGDLGLSVGFIRHNAKAEDGSKRPPIPFFTVWRRAAPDQPWRYVAE